MKFVVFYLISFLVCHAVVDWYHFPFHYIYYSILTFARFSSSHSQFHSKVNTLAVPQAPATILSQWPLDWGLQSVKQLLLTGQALIWEDGWLLCGPEALETGMLQGLGSTFKLLAAETGASAGRLLQPQRQKRACKAHSLGYTCSEWVRCQGECWQVMLPSYTWPCLRAGQ